MNVLGSLSPFLLLSAELGLVGAIQSEEGLSQFGSCNIVSLSRYYIDIRSAMPNKRNTKKDLHSNQWVLLAQESVIDVPDKAVCGPVFTRLRNPKTGTAALYLFNSGASQVYEVKAFDEEYRSWFIGQSVQHDGRLLFVTPLDPLFLILPYLIQANEKQGKFQPVDQVIKDEDFPGCSNVLNCTRTLQSLHHITDEKEIGNRKFYKYNQEKTLGWLKKKAEQTVKALKDTSISVGGGVQSSMLIRNKPVTEVTEEDYLRYAHGLLSDYIPADLSIELRKFLELPAVPTKTAVGEPPSKKRKISDKPVEAEEDYTKFNSDSKEKKPSKMTAAQKSLAKVDKSGMKNISAFFASKNKAATKSI
ncbi:ribonuclease H2 subunit B isoform X1 [Chiloscyllium plagiosum]|uniref:ribonuclease H2 subunit B isoform X1 n=1 Tax=Chiloscyllium plagiosum TaxID=36176 RepID=UPI001CB84505|nr:ribonuclease H2 subunit B isoform X1 [Chiloscyllium plagiosum]